MPHVSSPCRVSFDPFPDATWNQLAQQLRRRYLPMPLRPEQEDLVSESLLRAFASPPPDGNWYPWVNRIFSNLALDRLRVMTRATHAHAQLASTPAEPLASPEDNALAHEEKLHLQAALQSLPAALHDAVAARFFATDATENDVHPTTARVHVHRGIARLRSMLCSLRALFVPAYAPLATGTIGAVMLAQVSLSTPMPSPLIATADEASAPAVPAMMQATSRPQRVAAAKRDNKSSEPQATIPSFEAALPPQLFDFEDDVVEGELNAADMTLVQVPLMSDHASLLEIPPTMIGPLLKSLEDI